MKNIFTLIASLITLFNGHCQTIKDSIFNEVYIIKKETVIKSDNLIFIGIPIETQKTPVVLMSSDRNVSAKLFCDRRLFLPEQNEFILITPDWEFIKEIREIEKREGIHIKAEKHKFYNIKRNITDCKIDSLSRSIHDVRNPIVLNYKDISSKKDTKKLLENSNNIIGSWKEIEYRGNDGANDYTTKTENETTLNFHEDNVISDGLGNIGTYNIDEKNLHIMLAKQNKFYRITLEDKMLYLTPVTSKYELICDEGCAYIYIKSENPKVNVQEENIISGKITSKEEINGMFGVNIQNKTLNKGTVTDIYGQFVIKASKNDDIFISFPNMQTIEFKVTYKKNYDFFLEEYVRKKTPKEIRQWKRELRKKGFIHYE
jgi:CarboxypepD_reg-like domain